MHAPGEHQPGNPQDPWGMPLTLSQAMMQHHKTNLATKGAGMAKLCGREATGRSPRAWLLRHGLGDAPLTPLLAVRLAVRLRARILGNVLLAALIIAASLVRSADLMATGKFGGFGPHQPWLILVLGALIAGLLLARALLDAWVRRVDRRAGAALGRRVAHPIQPGWRALLGRPYAVVAGASFAGAFALGASAPAVGGDSLRYGAIM